jgi:hydroxymethylbilane synthase
MSVLPQPTDSAENVGLRICQPGCGRRTGENFGLHLFLRRMQRGQLCRVRSLMQGAVRIGTRGSRLALWQAEWVKGRIEQANPGLRVELRIIKTKGDKILDVPLARVGGKGLFVKEIEDQLLEREIDLAVHSMKDMPADIPGGLSIGAVPVRENPLDVLISRNGIRLEDLKPGAIVGTSSLRRSAQLLHLRPDLVIQPLRGNLDTRIRKLAEGGLDAIVVAAAGVIRLGMAECIHQVLEPDQMLPAVGQGALCVEIRLNDSRAAEILSSLDDSATRSAVAAERAFLRRLEGGCQVPIAAHARIEGEVLHMDGLVSSVDGKQVLRETASGAVSEAESIGAGLAGRLLSYGADQLLKELKTHAES